MPGCRRFRRLAASHSANAARLRHLGHTIPKSASPSRQLALARSIRVLQNRHQSWKVTQKTITTAAKVKRKHNTMKLDALEESAAAAREQARRLEKNARKAGGAARAAKDKARQDKAKLKLAKREAKQSRRAAKEAKSAFAEAQIAAEKANAKAGAIDEKVKKFRKQSRPIPVSTQKREHAPVHKRFVAKPTAAAPKSPAAKPRPRTFSRVKLAGILTPEPPQPVASDSGADIQVPREFTPPPTPGPSENHVPAPRSADESG